MAEGSRFHGEEGYYDALVSTRLRRLHRWLGVATGPFVVLFALSGVALLARDGLEAVLEGTPPPLRVAGVAATPASVVEIARARFPGAEPRSVRAPRRADEAYRVLLEWRGERVEVWVDPYAREVMRSRLPDRSVLVAIHSLHASLHLGRAGHALVALLGLALALQGALGVWLWWPRPRREAGRVALPVHRVIGAAAMVGSLVLALSGAYLAARQVAAPPSASPRLLEPANQLAARLHRGDVGGWAGATVWAVTGLALPILVVSGYALAVRR